jgi:hypothetical protein
MMLSTLGGYFKQGADHYATLQASGATSSPEVLAAFINIKMCDWDPKISGKAVLDPATKEAASRMLAGLIINLSTAGL